MKHLSEYTNQELKSELQGRGYYTSNLWQEADIDTLVENYNDENNDSVSLLPHQKQEILNIVLNGDGCMQNINEELSYAFDDYIKDRCLSKATLNN